MSDNIIQKEEIVNLIRSELTTVMEENYNLYKDYNVIIAVEQEFDKHAKNGLKDKNIYIVLKFGAASINYGQTVLPVSFTVLSEQNKCDISFKLLTDFVNKYNLEINQDKTIRQVYESPSVSSNFNAVYEGYRSILTISAFFVISKNANFFDFQYGIDDENVTTYYDIPVITSSFSGDFYPDTQPFYNASNFGTSAIKTGQLVVSFTTFLLDNIEVVNDALSVALKKSCVNKTFKFKINFKNEALTTEDNFKLINLNAKQDIGDIPMISLTFSL